MLMQYSKESEEVLMTDSNGQPKRKMTQILSFTAQSGKVTTPVIYQDAIEEILSSQLSADLPLFVISITGVYRSGKSFLTNVFISYLQMLEIRPKTISEWISSDQTFSDVEWARGVDSVTHGVWMTSQPYVITDKNGGKVGVLILDCQGIYDVSRSNETSDAIVALLAMEMSSVHVVNVSGDINASDLRHIEAVVAYSTAYGADPWFNYLLLLHRNWDSKGELGAGTQYFKTVASERRLSKTEENIAKAFKSHSEFMLPTPGENVRTASKAGCLQDLIQDEETKNFFCYLERLCSWLFVELAFEQKYQMPKKDLLTATKRFKELLSDENLLHIQTQSQLMTTRAVMQVYYDLQENHFPHYEESINVQAKTTKESLEEDIESIRKSVMFIADTRKTALSTLSCFDEDSNQTWRKVERLIDEWLTDIARLKEAQRQRAENLRAAGKTAATVGGVIALSALSGGAGLALTGAVAAFEVGAGCAMVAAAGGAAMGAVGSGIVGAGVAIRNWLSTKPDKTKDETEKKEA